jgi:hypothetical protein
MAVLQSTKTIEELQARLAAVEAENARLKANGQGRMTFKVSDKGALSVYGMGRFPVTLYRSQWERLLSSAEQIKQFIADNSAKLAVKD